VKEETRLFVFLGTYEEKEFIDFFFYRPLGFLYINKDQVVILQLKWWKERRK
jgi:hypothetical protein